MDRTVTVLVLTISAEEEPKLKHPPGVYEAPAQEGWHRLIAIDLNGKLIAVSEFREGVCDVQVETRRLLDRIESHIDGYIAAQEAPQPRIALVR